MRRTYRSRSQSLIAAAILGSFGLVALETVCSSFVRALGSTAPSAVGWGFFDLAVVLGMWWCGLRLVFSMVQLSPQGVVVRNVFQTRRVPWEQIETFSGQHGIVLIHLKSGDQVPITALSGPNVLFRPSHRFVPEMAERLRAQAAPFLSPAPNADAATIA